MSHFSSKPCDKANAQCCCSGWIQWKPALCVLEWGTTAAIEAQVIYDGEVQSDMLSGAIMPSPNWGTWQLWIRCAADGPMYLAAETEVIDPLDYEDEEYTACVNDCEEFQTQYPTVMVTISGTGQIYSRLSATLVLNTSNCGFTATHSTPLVTPPGAITGPLGGFLSPITGPGPSPFDVGYGSASMLLQHSAVGGSLFALVSASATGELSTAWGFRYERLALAIPPLLQGSFTIPFYQEILDPLIGFPAPTGTVEFSFEYLPL
jgi:hypothetical protein